MSQQSLFGGAVQGEQTSPSTSPGAASRRQGGSGRGVSSPLAERMRPQNLDEVMGQGHLLSEEGPLRLLAASETLPSVLLWGPPGTGKTTLARILAAGRGYFFKSLSAVMAGVKDVRATVEEARVRSRGGSRTVLFLDEIHRFNKSQQDALLPHVESGLVTLIGATTENPSFEVNAALLSRMTVFRLESLDAEGLQGLVRRALGDAERGLGAESPPVRLSEDAIGYLAAQGDGDARKTLGLLEQLAMARRRLPDPSAELGIEDIKRLLLLRGPRYDKGGEEHYNVISAFIKSVRGGDPDAAVYYLARMLEGGEDARFIARRLIILASEDIGNADPRGLPLAIAAAQAVEHVGLPEAQIALAQATTFLAAAPKSNRAYMAIKAARAEVQRSGSLAVPMHLRNASTQYMKSEGYGDGYAYPHDHPGHHVRQEYLPKALKHKRFYEPSDQGAEARMAARLNHWWVDGDTP